VTGSGLGDTLSIAAVPHVIPAPTIPNGDVELAIGAPLAAERDEVIYLVCTHERIRWGNIEQRERQPVLRATGELGGGIRWDPARPWAHVLLPDLAQPSRVPWAILDAGTEEAAAPSTADEEQDPDGPAGQHREELLLWIYDRHLERAEKGDSAHGSVEGGQIEFRLEYIGKRHREALRRPAGAHHRVAQVLARTLLYEPHRLVYMLPCDLYTARGDSSTTDPVKGEPLARATRTAGIPRALLTSVAEEALIAWLGPTYNVQNTGPRRFPRSASAETLARHGIQTVNVALARLPRNVGVRGNAGLVDQSSTAHSFSLATGA
jgi:hypothetical protein